MVERYKETGGIFVQGSGEYLGTYASTRKTDYEFYKEVLTESVIKIKKSLVNLLKNTKGDKKIK